MLINIQFKVLQNYQKERREVRSATYKINAWIDPRKGEGSKLCNPTKTVLCNEVIYMVCICLPLQQNESSQTPPISELLLLPTRYFEPQTPSVYPITTKTRRRLKSRLRGNIYRGILLPEPANRK